MILLLDANLLLRISQPDHWHSQIAVRAVELLHGGGDECVIVPQSLYEFWTVATRPAQAPNGLGMTLADAETAVAEYSTNFRLLPDEPGILTHWRELVTDYQVMGLPGHDARYVAAMRHHGISHLLTFNAKHFRRYDGITVVIPDEIADSAEQSE